MWDLVNETPFAAERAWVRDKDGAEVWVVAVRATFAMAPDGQLSLGPEQVPVCQCAEYEDDGDGSPLVADTDLVECKQTTDVLVRGTAYAPGGEPSPEWTVRVQLDSIDKSLRVSGPRRWHHADDGTPHLSAPEPISKLPLSYRDAFGGVDLANPDGDYVLGNPVGCGFSSDPRALADQAAPSVEYANDPIAAWDHRPAPAGLGALSAGWSPRREAAGTHDDQWMRKRYPLPPEDRQLSYFQSAPRDQQTRTFLRGGEVLRLQGLTPNGFLELRLPNARFDVTTTFGNGSRRRHRMQLYTVIAEPDEQRLQMVWQTHLRCHHQVNDLLSTRVLLKRKLHARSADDTPPWMRTA